MRRKLRRDGADVHLEPKAFELLSLLIDARPRVVTKAELHERLWPRGVVSDATLVALVKDVRHALDDRDRSNPLIRTVHRVGYAFEPRIESTESRPAMHWLVTSDRRLALTSGDNVVGRTAQAEVWIDHSTVSRQHARIVVDGTSARVEDLASKNGTTVGGSRLTGSVALRDGDPIAFGAVQLTYRCMDANPSTVTQLGTVARLAPER
ncbi:MAG TPA: FHA domain-containing protein [Gammaproteobacteria bacterium]|jgi:DNA-binding winged helix-turn-helix (wHTH) protein|nr:FHA domain-containing protein [Gammaproteobacteria bacterium]